MLITVATLRLKNFYQRKLYESPRSPFYNPDYSKYDERDKTFDLEAIITAKYLLDAEGSVSSVKEAIQLLKKETSINSLFLKITDDILWSELDEEVIKLIDEIKEEIKTSTSKKIPHVETDHTFYNFQSFLKIKREERFLTAKSVAEALGVSRRYYSDVENGARLPFCKKNLIMLSEIFNFDEKDKELMFNLAAKGRGEVPLDISSYFASHEYMHEFVRRIKKAGINQKRLFSFLKRVEKKSKI